MLCRTYGGRARSGARCYTNLQLNRHEDLRLISQPCGHSLIIPVYRNEENIPDLILALDELASAIEAFEVVFVVDGSPDNSAELLAQKLPGARFAWQLVELSRNFGAFSAIRQGLALARGQFLAVMAADLQEPPELIIEFFRELNSGLCDLIVGVRASRIDPLPTRLSSQMYWWFYKRLIMRQVPTGGVDVFGCNRAFCTALLSLEERDSSLIGQLFWLGFRRKEIKYERRPRLAGNSAWNFRRRFRYMMDSIFAFSDLPISILLWLGTGGIVASFFLTVVIIGAWIWGEIDVRGYVPIMLAIVFFRVDYDLWTGNPRLLPMAHIREFKETTAFDRFDASNWIAF